MTKIRSTIYSSPNTYFVKSFQTAFSYHNYCLMHCQNRGKDHWQEIWIWNVWAVWALNTSIAMKRWLSDRLWLLLSLFADNITLLKLPTSLWQNWSMALLSLHLLVSEQGPPGVCVCLIHKIFFIETHYMCPKTKQKASKQYIWIILHSFWNQVPCVSLVLGKALLIQSTHSTHSRFE